MSRSPSFPPLLLALVLTACSDPDAASGNAVDVGAAASRAEATVANYAAGRRSADERRAAPAPVPSPTVAAQGGPAVADAETPAAVVGRYLAAIEARRYGEAWRLWEGAGAASQMSEAAFAASFDRFATYRGIAGMPSAEDAGAGQRYVTIPVTATGMLKAGGAFRLSGLLVLHKVADGIESDDPEAHAWRIRSSGMKPQPDVTASRAP